MEDSMVVAQNIKHRITICSSNSPSEYILKRTEIRDSKRYLYIHVYSSIICNSLKVEAAQVSIDGWLGK